MPARRLLICVAALALLAAACGGDDGDDSATTTTTGPGAGSSTTQPVTTDPSTSTSDPATPGTAQACPPVAVPGGATEVMSASGDLDGDGAADDVTSYRHGGAWRLQVSLVVGGADLAVDVVGPGALRAVGVADLDEDGTGEVVAVVGAGASAQIVGLFDFADCQLTAITLDGEPARFPVGASAQQASALECAGPGSGDVDLTVFEATSADGTDFMVTSRLLGLDGNQLGELASDVFAATAATLPPPFDCLGLELA